MSTVHVKIDIHAPVRRVWDIVMDPYQLEDWVTIHRALGEVSSRRMTKGSTMGQTLHMRGVSFHVHWMLVDVKVPSHAEWVGRGPAGSRARIRYELSGDPEGPTRFEYINEFAVPGGKLGTVASRVIVGGASEREAKSSLARLKALAERG
jgi:uncharacterized protein YndB with AHSA1/START domain